jgi:hypothetical protein
MENQKLESLEIMAQSNIKNTKLSIEAIAEYIKNYHEKITNDDEIFRNFNLEDSLLVLRKFQADGLQLDSALQISIEDAITHFESIEENFQHAILGSALEKRIEQILETDDIEEKDVLVNNLFLKLSEKPTKLLKKLYNKKYLEQYKYAITYTSLMVFIAALKSSLSQEDDSVNFEKYIREYLAASQTDDKEIYKMKTFYLNNVSGENIKLGLNENDDENNLSKEVVELRKKYDGFINFLKNKYEDSKLYLKV